MEIIISLERQEGFRAGKFAHFLLPDFFDPGIYQMIDQNEQSIGYAVISLVKGEISGRYWALDERKAIAKQCGFTLGGLNKSIRSTHFGRRFLEGERYMRLFKAAYIQTAEGLDVQSETNHRPARPGSDRAPGTNRVRQAVLSRRRPGDGAGDHGRTHGGGD